MKHALVTGGDSGIGLAIVERLCVEGFKILVLDIRSEGIKKESLKEFIQTEQIVYRQCDISDGKSVKLAIEKSGFDHLDVLINNAGVAHVGDIKHTEEEDFDRLYNINVKGMFNSTRFSIPKMSSGGLIINMSSVAAHVGIDDRFAYSMSKGAVHAMTLSLAKDCLKDGIRCVSISPGRVHTPFVDDFIAKNYPDNQDEMFKKLSKTQPIGRMGQPEEIASLVSFLCSDNASFFTGTDFPIDGGFIKLNN